MFDQPSTAIIGLQAARLEGRILETYQLAIAGGVEEPAIMALDLRDSSASQLAQLFMPESEIQHRILEARRRDKVAWVFSGMPAKQLVGLLIETGMFEPVGRISTDPGDGYLLAMVTFDRVWMFKRKRPA